MPEENCLTPGSYSSYEQEGAHEHTVDVTLDVLDTLDRPASRRHGPAAAPRERWSRAGPGRMGPERAHPEDRPRGRRRDPGDVAPGAAAGADPEGQLARVPVERGEDAVRRGRG